MSADRLKKIAVFASGTGSNFQQVYADCQAGKIPAEICLLISNNPGCLAMEFARAQKIRTAIINSKKYPGAGEYETAFHQELESCSPDLLLLAGFMKMIPSSVVQKYQKRILNIHPALLPQFGGKGYYGGNVHRAVIDAGVKISGATVHFVDEVYDHGPIVAQTAVSIGISDTAESLAEKVLAEEHKLFPQVVRAFCEDRIFWKDNIPFIREIN